MFGVVLCSLCFYELVVHGHSSPSPLSYVAVYDCLYIIMIIVLLFTLYRWGPPALGTQGATLLVAEQAFRPCSLSFSIWQSSCFFPDQLFCNLLVGTQHKLLSEFRSEPHGLMVQPWPLKNEFDVVWGVRGWLTYLAFVSKGFRKVD